MIVYSLSHIDTDDDDNQIENYLKKVLSVVRQKVNGSFKQFCKGISAYHNYKRLIMLFKLF